MKKIYSNILRCLALISMALVSSQAFAVDIAGTITDGMTVTYDRAKEDNQPIYEIKPTEDVTMKVVTNYQTWLASTTHKSTFIFTIPDPENGESGGTGVPLAYSQDGTGGRIYFYYLSAGQTYYVKPFFGAYLYDQPKNVTFTFTFTSGKEAPHITSLYPAPGNNSTYNLVDYPVLQVLFNTWGTFTFGNNTRLKYIDNDGVTKSTNLEYEIVEGEYVGFKVKQAIDQVKKDMKDGSIFSLIISSPKVNGEAITGEYVNSDGNIELTYTYKRLTGIETAVYPSTFYSYFPKGDADGIVTLTFDAPLQPLQQQLNRATPMQFSIRAGEYKAGGGENDKDVWPQITENAPLSIDGNTVTIDLTGVIRPNPESADYEYVSGILKDEPVVSIWIQFLLDANGDPVDFYNSNLVQINNLPYVLLDKITMQTEITPMSGSLKNVDEIEVWTVNETFKHVKIDSFQFAVEDDPDSPYTVTDYRTEADPFDPNSSLIYIPVPAIVKVAEGNITLSAVLTTLDGYDYSISASYYNEKTETPDPDQPDQPDQPEDKYMTAAVTVLNPAQIMVSSVGSVTVTWDEQEITLCEDAHAEWYLNEDLTDYENLGELKDGELMVFLTNVTPDEEGGGIAPWAEGDIDGDEEIKNGLIIDLPFDAFVEKGVFNIVIPAGTVKNAAGEVNEEALVTVLVVDSWAGAVNVTPSVTNYETVTVESLPVIEVNFEDADYINLNDPCEIRLDQTVISDGDYMEFVYDDSGSVTGLKFNVASLTQAKGTYEFFIPGDAIVINDMYVNNEFLGIYVVSGDSGVTLIEAIDGRYDVYTLTGVKVLSTDNASDLKALAPGLYIINGKKVMR